MEFRLRAAEAVYKCGQLETVKRIDMTDSKLKGILICL